jgi:hypothetical protein
VAFHQAEATGHPNPGCPRLVPARNGVRVPTTK